MKKNNVSGNAELGKRIRSRRFELQLTIEEAATRAGVGTKTWSRYEAGESIRRDKVAGVLKALNWSALPNEANEKLFDIRQYKSRSEWPKVLEEEMGEAAAVSFVAGSDILLDHIQEDMEELSSMPKGSHVGQLDFSWLRVDLPEQFLVEYDYEFLYCLKSVVNQYRSMAQHPYRFVAHSVMQELALYLIVEESRIFMEMALPYLDDELKSTGGEWDEWPFELFDDNYIVTWLYSGFYIDSNHNYHFSHWREEQFYMDCCIGNDTHEEQEEEEN